MADWAWIVIGVGTGPALATCFHLIRLWRGGGWARKSYSEEIQA